MIDHEIAIRLTLFAGVLAAVALWELAVPRRRQRMPKGRRWRANLGLATLNAIVLRLFTAGGAVGFAWMAAQRQWGWLHHLQLFEVALNAGALFNHANVGIPRRLERVLRWILVTPDMHRVHHSAEPSETHRNFGFNLSCWDRVFGTYRAQPAAGHQGMTIGLPDLQHAESQTFLWLLALPFRRPSAASWTPEVEPEQRRQAPR